MTYLRELRTNKIKPLRGLDDSLLVRSTGWRIVNKTRYTLAGTTINHQLSSNTLLVLIFAYGQIYIDYDAATPNPSTAPIFITNGYLYLPTGGASVINIMGDSGSQIGIIELS